MDLRRLRYFVTVAETRNFRAAAEKLFMAQPPLSQQIRALERDVGAALFHRTTRRVELTPAGAVLLELATNILRLADEAVDATRRAERGEVGRLAVGFTGSATYELLPMLARRFREQFPDVELSLHGEMLTHAQADALSSGSIDIGLLRPPIRDPELKVEIVRREALIALLPEGHRLTGQPSLRLENLARESFVSYPAFSVVTSAVEDACLRAGFRPRVAIEVQETSTLVSLVAAHVGVAIVPDSVRHLHVSGVSYVPLTGTQAFTELAVAWNPKRLTAVGEQFLAMVRNLVTVPEQGGSPAPSGEPMPDEATVVQFPDDQKRRAHAS